MSYRNAFYQKKMVRILPQMDWYIHLGPHLATESFILYFFDMRLFQPLMIIIFCAKILGIIRYIVGVVLSYIQLIFTLLHYYILTSLCLMHYAKRPPPSLLQINKGTSRLLHYCIISLLCSRHSLKNSAHPGNPQRKYTSPLLHC